MTAVEPGQAIGRIRVALVLLGVVAIGFGAYTLVTTVKPHQIGGLATWLLAAVILHDVILSPFVVAAGLLLRRAGRSFRAGSLAVAQVAIVVGAVLLSTVLPEIAAKHHGRNNPTVVPFDYVLRLGIVEGVLVVVVVVALAVGARRRPRLPVAR